MGQKAYKIRDVRTGKYISIGYKSKSTWNKFPSAVIKHNKHIIPEGSKDYEIDVFELVKIETVSISGNSKETGNPYPINKDWFKTTFERISSDEGNGEKVENVNIVSLGTETSITFDVDCGRYGVHRGHEIIITSSRISSNFYDSPIEGSGIETDIKKAIQEKLSQTI